MSTIKYGRWRSELIDQLHDLLDSGRRYSSSAPMDSHYGWYIRFVYQFLFDDLDIDRAERLLGLVFYDQNEIDAVRRIALSLEGVLEQFEDGRGIIDWSFNRLALTGDPQYPDVLTEAEKALSLLVANHRQ